MIQINNLISELENRFNKKIISYSSPPQGMGSFVIFVTFKDTKTYAVKVSDESNNDATVLELLHRKKIRIAVPYLQDAFILNKKSIVVMERIVSTILEEEISSLPRYIPSMIKNLRQLHKIKSRKAGYLNSEEKFTSFKDLLASTFNGKNANFSWSEITKRKLLNERIVTDGINIFLSQLENLDVDSTDYSLLHTDFNQRNLFVNKEEGKISAIIDWGEAMFGHPVFDFARIRMMLWHFDFPSEEVQKYYKLMEYTSREIELDNLFLLYRVIEYLAYYSEEDNDFNNGRIKKHLAFLEGLGM